MNEDLDLLMSAYVVSGKSHAFQNWLDENFLLKLQDTGCFTLGHYKMSDILTKSKEGFHIITRLLHFRNKETQREFNQEYLPRFNQIFLEQWVHEINLRQLQFYVTSGKMEFDPAAFTIKSNSS